MGVEILGFISEVPLPQRETLSPYSVPVRFTPSPDCTPMLEGFPVTGEAAAIDLFLLLTLIYAAGDSSPDLSGNLQLRLLIYDLGPWSSEPRK